MHLQCDQHQECTEPAETIDDAGWIYCMPHGLARRSSGRRVRQLLERELRRLERGETLARY